MILEKETIRQLVKHLKNYKRYHQAILEREEELINSSSNDLNSGIKSQNKISKSTEEVAIRLSSDYKLQRLKKLVQAIDDLRIGLLDEPVKLKILNYKYLNQAERVNDIYVTQRITDEGYPLQANSTYYELKEQILYKFEKILANYGIKIELSTGKRFKIVKFFRPVKWYNKYNGSRIKLSINK